MKRRSFLGMLGALLATPLGWWRPKAPPERPLGLSIRMVRSYDIEPDRFPCRFEMMYGSSVLRPELACRVVDVVETYQRTPMAPLEDGMIAAQEEYNRRVSSAKEGVHVWRRLPDRRSHRKGWWRA